jgi:hypothetical protein
MNPSGATFTNVAQELGLTPRQCNVRTSPNCLFDQWDPKLMKWDKGGFCMEETMTGGACVGDVDGDGIDDLYYARMDGTDKLYLNTGSGEFLDGTKVSGIFNEDIRSNGCYIFDMDNDGDNDIYVSTMGNDRFYLFVNDGQGHFVEDAVARGLANSKRDGRLTAGFTITVGDFDLDGDLDVITTEWFPWLDHVEHEHDQKMAVDAENATNARFFINLGDAGNANGRLGYFSEITDEAGIRGDIRVRNTITHLIHSACETIPVDKLRGLLKFLEEPVTEGMGDEEVHLAFESMITLAKEGLMQTRTMGYTEQSSNPDHYVHLTIPPQHIQNADSILLVLTAHKGKGPVQMFVSDTRKGGTRPTSRRNGHMFKSKRSTNGLPVRLTLDVGSAYGMKSVTIGVKCTNRDGGCRFDVTFLPTKRTVQKLSEFNCAARRKMQGFASMLKTEQFDGSLKHAEHMIKEHRVAGQGVKQVGVFRVDLVSPWVASEVFFEYAIGRMRRLDYDVRTIRNELKKLILFGKNLDEGREKRMVRTETRLKQNVALKLPGATEHNWHEVLQVAMDAKRETKQIKSKSKHYDSFGVRHDDTAMNGGLNHAFDLPLVGAFQFAAKFADLDMDGFPDLIISGDFGTSQLYYNNGNGTFVHGNFHLVEDMLDNSMGCTVGDWDMDGLLDVMFTSASISENDLDDLNQIATTAGMLLNFRGNHLYKNLGGRRFQDVTDEADVRESGWGWGAFFFDFDNDGDLDALNGNGMDDPETTDDDWAVNQRVKLYVNRGEEDGFRMVDEAEARGIASTQENRGAMSFDYDGDGDLDVFVVNHAEQPSLFRNDGGNYYDWLRVEVYEPHGSASIGAKVFLLPDECEGCPPWNETADPNVPGAGEQAQEVGSTAAFLGQGEAAAHFGLGLRSGAPVHRVRVVWNRQVPGTPGAKRTETMVFRDLPVRSTLVVRKGEGGAAARSGDDLPECPPVSDGGPGTVLQQEARRSFVRRKIAPPVEEL